MTSDVGQDLEARAATAEKRVAELEAELASLASIREDGNRFRMLTEHIQEVFWVAAPDMSRILYVSPGYERVWGRSTQSLFTNPRSYLDAIHPADRSRVIQALEKQLGGLSFSQEYRIVRPDGAVVWIWDRGLPVTDVAGVVQHYVGIALDVTSLKRTLSENERLAVGLEQMRLLFDESPEPLALLDGEGLFIRTNREFEELFGATPIPRNVLERIKAVCADRVELVEMQLAGPSGVREVDLRCFCVEQPDGNLYLIAARDVTSQRLVEEVLRQGHDALRAANQELLRASRSKDEFFSSMSHELRTPLASILGLAEALSEGVYGPLGDRPQQALGTIGEVGRHLLALINDVLDLSRIEAGAQTVAIDEVGVVDVCEASVMMVRPKAKPRRVIVDSIVPAELAIQADPVRLKQVLVNLLDNAVKFSSSDTRVVLEVERQQADEVLRFSVSDQAPGISTADSSALFQPFVQLDGGLSRQRSGAGLGLALVHRLTRLHGGAAGLVTVPGGGNRFFVDLPVTQVLSATTEGAAPSSVSAHDRSEPRSLDGRVLLVTDESVASERVAPWFGEVGEGLVVCEVSELDAASLAYGAPALVLVDLGRAPNRCAEVIRNVRIWTQRTHVPVIALSDILTEFVRGRYLGAGADWVLERPLTKARVSAALAAVGVKSR